MLNLSHSAHPLFRRVRDGNEQIVWFASHNDGKSYYIALFNAGESEAEISAALPFSANFSVLDIWEKACGEDVTDKISAKVKPHGAKLFKLTRK